MLDTTLVYMYVLWIWACECLARQLMTSGPAIHPPTSQLARTSKFAQIVLDQRQVSTRASKYSSRHGSSLSVHVLRLSMSPSSDEVLSDRSEPQLGRRRRRRRRRTWLRSARPSVKLCAVPDRASALLHRLPRDAVPALHFRRGSVLVLSQLSVRGAEQFGEKRRQQVKEVRLACHDAEELG